MSNQYSGGWDADPETGCVVIGAAMVAGGLLIWTIVWLFFGLTGVLFLFLTLVAIALIGALLLGRS